MLYVGIDAGQSRTVAAIADETGRELGRGEAGAADEIGQDATSTRLRDALRAAYDKASMVAKLPPESRCARVVAGISGYEGRVYGRVPDLPCGELVLLHDAVIAHAGAFQGGPGVAVIAGTGSVAYGADERGESVTVGGWGYLFGDEGSAFWFARRAIEDAVRDEDAGKKNPFAQTLLRHFGSGSLHALVRSFYAGEITRTALAEFAHAAIERSRSDPGGERYVQQCAQALADLAVRTMARIGMHAGPLAFLGGMTKSAAMKSAIASAVEEAAPQAKLIEPAGDAVSGALFLARTR
ncbi:MAG TPA: BadF/BadG/BcrA/BcrD ATPase family protein [Candidatus Rubrimentiphilum sp.]|nr:BadF/BadG/BcrA/BcrD ATPase family protein [Candidatus Rubrimentiphilum sp.]